MTMFARFAGHLFDRQFKRQTNHLTARRHDVRGAFLIQFDDFKDDLLFFLIERALLIPHLKKLFIVRIGGGCIGGPKGFGG